MGSAMLQVSLAVVMFLTTAIAGFIPLKLLRILNKSRVDNKKHGKWLSLLSCFSGGVFLGTCFLDIIPHTNENYEDFKLLSGTGFEFPLPQFFTCIGFFLVYLVEEICIKVFAMKHGNNHADHVEKAATPAHKDNLNLRKSELRCMSLSKPNSRSSNSLQVLLPSNLGVLLLKRKRRRAMNKKGRGKPRCPQASLKVEDSFSTTNKHVDRAPCHLHVTSTQALLGIKQDDDGQLKITIQTHRFSLVMEETANYAVAEASEGSLLKSLTFAVAMSFHSILEGFALGVQDTTARIFTLFISLILHKGVEAFSVGLQISKGNSNKLKAVVATIIVYALMTPIGSGLGTLLRLSNISPLHKDAAVLILESLAAGTFIYVTFLEILAQEKDNEHNSLKQLLAIFIGFAVIAALQIAFGEHGHEGPHIHTLPPAFNFSTTLVPH